MPSTMTTSKPEMDIQQSRKMRVIHRDSFGTADRGEDWGWSAEATWWHQMRGVKGFHKRIFSGFCAKSDFPEPPTVDDMAAAYNEQTSHTWEVSD